MGLGFGIWGVVQATRSCPEDRNGCFPSSGILFGMSAFFLAGAGAMTWWHLYSREEKMLTFENLPKSGASSQPVRIMLGPGSVAGTF
jgi:hypothetical protein